MRSRQYNTALATQMTNGERHFRRRTHIFEKIYFNAVGGEYIGGSFRKQAAVVAAVVPYHHRNLRKILEALLQIVGKPLCGGSYRVDIHTIAAYTHNSAQTAGSKLQIFVKSFYEFG